MKKILFLLLFATVFISVKAQDLNEYIGIYKFPDGSVVPSVEVKLENGILVGYSIQGSSPLEKIGKDTFSVVNFNGLAYFFRNADNAVTSVKVVVQDLILEGQKQISGLAFLNRRFNEALKTKRFI